MVLGSGLISVSDLTGHRVAVWDRLAWHLSILCQDGFVLHVS